MNGILETSHPSFGTARAAFLFALGTRQLVVEAPNMFAVATLERVLIQNNQTVSSKCRVLCVFRDCRIAGIRDDSVDEVSYIDFVTDIVDPGFLLSDPVTTACFSKSITPEDRAIALAKAKALGIMDSDENDAEVEVEIEEEDEDNTSETGNKLRAALSGLGFKKSAVDKFVHSLGSRVTREPIADLLREGLRKLS